MRAAAEQPIGILLAAGRSRRFGDNKLIAPLADGTPLAVAAARNLRLVLNQVAVVVGTLDGPLPGLLKAEACDVIHFPHSHAGMGSSLAFAVSHCAKAVGWLVALADMPFVKPQTIRSVATQLASSHSIVAPIYQGKRGHPVGFGRDYLAALARLRGDRGGHRLLEKFSSQVRLVEVDDPGIFIDVDTPSDLDQLNRSRHSSPTATRPV